ncbi:ABC transporter permease [Clostridium sp. AF19-22AC]|jgi:ribose/xylose/arabinose/galactoside ABC-type transport system permease subunit|uniref:ABC transporter permease n=1 Tax=Clostridia TaxID=186801 RepID=UPI000E51F460|nr:MULTISPECIES: ABC transporter permease [Clostridia]RHR20443.1 ABC transporter permease [Clostridium sp. AF19-22AC]
MKAVKRVEVSKVLTKYGIFIGFLLLCIIMGTMSPNFISGSNVLTILRQVSYYGMLSLGVMYVILTGGIDLSVGSIMCLAGLVSAHYSLAATDYQLPLGAAVLIGLALASLCGFINGVLVAKVRLAPFIVTLATSTIIRGICLIYSDGRPITGYTDAYKMIGQTSQGIIPMPVLIFAVLFIITLIVLGFTLFGRYLYAVGGNEECAVACGINVTRVKTLAYTICGLLAGFAGIVLCSRLNAASPNTGEGYELNSIAAVVMGGVSLSGGRGNVFGVLVGVLIIGVITNGLDILNVSSYYQDVIKGLIILLAVFLDRKNN